MRTKILFIFAMLLGVLIEGTTVKAQTFDDFFLGDRLECRPVLNENGQESNILVVIEQISTFKPTKNPDFRISIFNDGGFSPIQEDISVEISYKDVMLDILSKHFTVRIFLDELDQTSIEFFEVDLGQFDCNPPKNAPF